jgi:hypothetical protein
MDITDDNKPIFDEWNAARRQACRELDKAIKRLRHRAQEVSALEKAGLVIADDAPWWARECLEVLEHVTGAYDLVAGLAHPVDLLDEMADL